MDLEREDEPTIYEFGWWPEIVGAIGVVLLITFLFTNARGIL